jgi:hypothetical protein
MNLKDYAKIIFAVLYLSGRICLMSCFSFSNEDKKFINLINLPQYSYTPAKTAIQNERLTPSVIRNKKDIQIFYPRFSPEKNSSISSPFFIRSIPYFGQFIDPPKLS